jgi:hypothetical protein
VTLVPHALHLDHDHHEERQDHDPHRLKVAWLKRIHEVCSV